MEQTTLRNNGRPDRSNFHQENGAGTNQGDIDFSRVKGFLRELGLVGLEDLERPIVCSLVTGDPLLLIGTHGTAKTALVRVLAETVDKTFHAYDASKAMFEDLIGFPNPTMLQDGELDYVTTDLSIWDKEFVLVDEISRAKPQTQNKWLEIIRSRTVMGRSLDNLDYVFAAMNPPGAYEGAMPLDPALSGRCSLVIVLPDCEAMGGGDRARIMDAVGGDDARGTDDAFEQTITAGQNLDLMTVVHQTRDRLPGIRKKYGGRLGEYLSLFVDEIYSTSNDQTLHLDGRRMGMIKRNILTALAADPPDSSENIESVIQQILPASLPHEARGMNRPKHMYEMAHVESFSRVWGDHSLRGVDPSLDGQALINRALAHDSPSDVIPDLAAMHRIFDGVFDPEAPVSVTAESANRVINTAGEIRRLIRDHNRGGPNGDAILLLFWTQRGKTDTLASVLLSWWIIEKTQSNAIKFRNVHEQIPDLHQQLVQKLQSVLRRESK